MKYYIFPLILLLFFFTRIQIFIFAVKHLFPKIILLICISTGGKIYKYNNINKKMDWNIICDNIFVYYRKLKH